jgi:hypothetical protein
MIRIGLAAESRGDAHRLAASLADRVLVTKVAWLDGLNVEDVRRYAGTGDEPFMPLKKASARAREAKVAVFGRDRSLDADEAHMYVCALRLFEEEPVRPDAVILVRDLDRKDRRLGFEQAVAWQGSRWHFPIIGAFPAPEAEAWRLVTWVPDTDHARATHAQVVRDLGFDPIRSPERLTSTAHGAVTDAKAVWKRVLGDDRGRADARWETFPLDAPSEARQAAGLDPYLDQLRTVLVQTVQHGPRRGA